MQIIPNNNLELILFYIVEIIYFCVIGYVCESLKAFSYDELHDLEIYSSYEYSF